MTDKRGALRRRSLKTGFIIISDKAPKLECTVRDISETGAKLQVSTTFGIPATFDAIVDGTRRHCHAQWRTENQLGIKFVA